MILVEYYDYILNKFKRMLNNTEDANDYTQELFLNYIVFGQDDLNKGVSLKFVNMLITQTYTRLKLKASAIRRTGVMVELDEAIGYVQPYLERIYSKQLFDIVLNLNKPKLKNAILYWLDKLALPKRDEKYRQIVSEYQSYLRRAIA